MKMKHLLPILCVVLSLSACERASDTNPIDSMSGMKAAREKRLATAAADAIEMGRTKEALDYYRKLYAEKPRNRDAALNYAQLLRKTGEPEKALDIITRFTGKDAGDHDATPIFLNEYAAAQIQLGHFLEADKALARVLEDPKAADVKYDALNLSGISKDATGDHRGAEIAFRQALEGWTGDATSVNNNLALSIASQGRFDEALTILRRALLQAPQKTEIAQNIAIVENLRDQMVPKAPTSLQKKK